MQRQLDLGEGGGRWILCVKLKDWSLGLAGTLALSLAANSLQGFDERFYAPPELCC